MNRFKLIGLVSVVTMLYTPLAFAEKTIIISKEGAQVQCETRSDCPGGQDGLMRCLKGVCQKSECVEQADCELYQVCAQGVCEPQAMVRRNLGENVKNKRTGCKKHCKNCKLPRYKEAVHQSVYVNYHCVQCETTSDCKSGFSCRAFLCVKDKK